MLFVLVMIGTNSLGVRTEVVDVRVQIEVQDVIKDPGWT